jgi:ubiquinone biosynthesis protein UbiJ
MTALPFQWKPLAGRALEAALNRALALDPDTLDAMRGLDGRSVALAIEQPPLSLQVRVAGDRLVVGPVDQDVQPDLSVRSTLSALLAQLPLPLASARREAAPVGRLHVSGDAELARRLQRLAERFDPDWQRPFASVFGDVIGVQIANAVASALRQARVMSRNLLETTAEYLTEESRDVVGRDELNAFHDDVDTLRDDVERTAARIARLSSHIGGNA